MIQDKSIAICRAGRVGRLSSMEFIKYGGNLFLGFGIFEEKKPGGVLLKR